MIDFNTYEFAGIVAPGSVAVFAILALNPSLWHLGDAAFMIVTGAIAAYVLGHLVAAVGNLCEDCNIFKALRVRRPENVKFSDWKDGKRPYLSANQEEDLRKLVADKLRGNVDDPTQLKWIVKQMYILLLDDDRKYRNERLVTFNGLYNFSRGLAIAFAFAFVLSAVNGNRVGAAFCLVAAGLAGYRIVKFSDIYACELVQQFLLFK